MKPKKDLNYIAKVEKAIAKKYGDIAIQNPASFWNEEKEKKYLEQLKEETKQQAKVELEPKLEGRQAIMILAPEEKTAKEKINHK